MRKLSLLFVIISGLSLGMLSAQDASFSAMINNDSLLLGNRFAVVFSLENAQGEDFYFPKFDGFSKVGGPNMSSQMNFLNGKMTQRVSYTFYLEAHEVGDFYIEPASVKVNDHYLETDPVLVRVHPNPDGIIQPTVPLSEPAFGQDLFGDDFFKDFFNRSPFDQMNPPIDSLRQQKPAKKRKTTRI